jgi:hypothetical protein
MTILDAIKTLPFEVSDALIEKILADTGLNGSLVYSSVYTEAVDKCMAELCRIKVSEPDVTEGELSIRIDRAAILKLRTDILKKYNLDEGGLSAGAGLAEGESLW